MQNKVNGMTSVVVAGEPNPLQIGQKASTKLFDAHHRIWRGQPISIIDEARFLSAHSSMRRGQLDHVMLAEELHLG